MNPTARDALAGGRGSQFQADFAVERIGGIERQLGISKAFPVACRRRHGIEENRAIEPGHPDPAVGLDVPQLVQADGAVADGEGVTGAVLPRVETNLEGPVQQRQRGHAGPVLRSRGA